MSTSHRRKEKNEKSRRLSLHNDDEGSAARTRPFSFEDIMQRRKKKNLSEDVKGGVLEAKIMSIEGAVKNVSHGFESERDYKHHKDSSPVAERYVAEEERKLSSRKQEKKTSGNNKSEEGHVKAKDRGTLVLKSKVEVGSFRSENDMNSEIKGGKNNKQIRGRRDNDKRSTDNTEKEDGKRHSRDSRGKERHGKLSRGKSEGESKRKYQNGDDEKIKDRKKLDTGRHYETDNSARNKRRELSPSRFEEPKRRRERSRSRDHDDRRKRSRSPSRKDHKRASYNRTSHREVASHSLKDRSKKQHHADRSRLSTNGSSSHHSRRGESTSGLGGYSPRKRITEAAAKTPPPPDHSLEKKSAKWDVQPVGTGNILSGIVPNTFSLSSNNILSTGVQKLASAATPTSTIQLPSGVPFSVLATRNLASIDSIQLTQATRPVRRLYVENIPSSTSEKALVEWFNDLLLSSNANHIQGTQPCLSCIINKEKGEALVEFLTPEDASAALSFDGNSISGFFLKIRRPKDFVEVATGDVDKSRDAVVTISDVVKDSPNKIFIGGISKALSSKMLMEIVSAFGPLKAYHFVVNDDELNEPCAFLEYVDPSLTPKACAGLNGMKLGGKVLTAVQAIRSAELENTGNSSMYKIPEHAKPLLKQPTQVVKLKHVFNLEGFSSLSEPEVEEVVDDIRLECARFGNVKSINVVTQGSSEITSIGICEPNTRAQTVDFGSNLGREDNNLSGHKNDGFNGIDAVEFASGEQEHKEVEVPKDCCNDNQQEDDITEDKSCQTRQLDSDETAPNNILEELPKQLNSPKEMSEHLDDKVASTTMDGHGAENKLKDEDSLTPGDTDRRKQRTVEEFDGSKETELNVKEKEGSEEESFNLGGIFEVGCVFVEFGRTEAACTAAHCLHGRVFDDRIVSVEYVPLDHYRTRFLK